ncbi:hypothetical protein [Streptomyces sp. NPDC058683]|uniref:hypothetical protein n=1 Tax=Streptomyces sp. NPDC058683 TaxID=3346597 RepID=UPI0036463FAC
MQNAEDLDATDVRILTKERELLVAHNGSPVRLPDVLVKGALAPVATGVVAGAAAGAQDWARTAIEGLTGIL